MNFRRSTYCNETLADISIYSDLPDQGESRSDGTDRSNGDVSGDAT